MINYFPLQLYFGGSALMFLALIIRNDLNAFSAVLLLNIIFSTVTLFILKKYLIKAIFIHKFGNIALLTGFIFQDVFTESSLLLLYAVSDTHLVIEHIDKRTYVNVQYGILIYGAILSIFACPLNDALMCIFIVIMYILSLLPMIIKQKQAFVHEEIPLESPNLQDQSQKIDNIRESLKDSFSQDHVIHKHTSIDVISRQQAQTDQMSIEIIHNKSEQEWQQRVMFIPVGIILIGKFDRRVTFTNQYFDNLMIKTLGIATEEIKWFVLNTLKFKIIDQSSSDQQKLNYTRFISMNQSRGNIQDYKRSQSQQSNSKRKISSQRTIADEHHKDPRKTYSLNQVITKLQNGFFDRCLDDIDNTLEMYCRYLQVNLNVKVLHLQEQSVITVILQDYSRQKIEEQGEFKTMMINSFSHELRTPLNSASLFFRSAILDPLTPPEVKQRYIHPGLACLIRQEHLIDDIIDFSQIDANQFELRKCTFSLKDLVNELTQIFLYEYTSKELGLAFQVNHSTLTDLKTDYKRLVQVMVNILQNALKFSNQGYVLVTISGDGNIVKFEISDEGLGIGSAKLNHIQNILKDYHQQLDGWQGFGLIITQMLLRHLGPTDLNDLNIQSPGLNMGTKVSFCIVNYIFDETTPIRKSPRFNSLPDLNPEYGLKITIKTKHTSKQLLNQNNGPDTTISHLMKLHTAPKYLVTDLNRKYQQWYQKIEIIKQHSDHKCVCKTILSVDDEIFNQTSLSTLLSKLNYKIEAAFNGQQAIEMIENKPTCGSSQCKKYMLILMDCQMPVLDGWQCTKVLKQKFLQGLLQEIPIVGFTAFTSKAEVDRCKQVGMIEVLNKPLQVKKLKAIMDQLDLF